MNKKELLLLSIGIFLTVVAWLIADVYNATTQEKIKVKSEIPSLYKYKIKQDVLNVLNQKSE
jgi:hypothetical protein